MAKKPNITTIASGYYSRQALNNNFENLQNGFDNTLSLDGSTPNAMGADLDMNSNDILNADVVNASALRLDGVLVSSSSLTASGATLFSTDHTGDGTTVAYNTTYQAFIKDNTQVYIDGVYQNKAGYSISGTTLTFSEAPPLNAAIEIVVARSLDVAGTDAANVNYNQDGTNTTVELALDSLRSEEEYPPIFAYQSAVSDSTLIDVVPEAGQYHAFPNLTRVKNNRLVGVYWVGNGHSPTIAGDDLGEFRVIYSDDNGATWSTPTSLIGNMGAGSSGFAYYKALGTDSTGRAVLVGTIKIPGSGNQTGIMRSEDGVTWSTWTPISISGEGSIPSFPLPFGQLKTTPSGKLAIPFYTVGTGRWIGRIDDSVSETAAVFDQIVDATVLGGGNEFAICVVSELEQYAFLRQGNLTNQVPIYRTTDAGVTWSAFSDMNIDTSGGWLPQDAHLTSISGKLYVAVLLGARKTISLPAPDSPSAALFMAPLEEARVAGEFTFDRVHYWPLADDGEPRDAYIGSVYDKSSNSLAILTHSETAFDESKILAGAVRIGEVYDGSLDRTAVVRWNSVTYTDNGSSAKFEKIGNQVFGRIVMTFTGLDTTDTSNITLRATPPDFPYPVIEAGECSIDMSASTSGLNFSAGDVTKVAFTSSNTTVSITDGDAVPYTYNSGKINAAGTAVFYVQYTTG